MSTGLKNHFSINVPFDNHRTQQVRANSLRVPVYDSVMCPLRLIICAFDLLNYAFKLIK